MRRPVIYLAGLLLATGASFALTAGPASAAVSHGGPAAQAAYNPFDDGDEWYLDADADADSYSDSDSNSNADARNNSTSYGGGAHVDVDNTAINSSKDCGGGEEGRITESASVTTTGIPGILCFL